MGGRRAAEGPEATKAHGVMSVAISGRRGLLGTDWGRGAGRERGWAQCPPEVHVCDGPALFAVCGKEETPPCAASQGRQAGAGAVSAIGGATWKRVGSRLCARESGRSRVEAWQPWIEAWQHDGVAIGVGEKVWQFGLVVHLGV